MTDPDIAGRRVALITGGGSGLGAAMARRFAAAGWRVAVTDQHPERAESTRASLAGGGHAAWALDVTDAGHWMDARDRLGEFGRMDLLVNNAGVASAGLVEQTSLEDWQWVMDINVMGVVRGCHTFIPVLRAQGFGHIVNVASWAGLAAAPQIAAYGTAKAAVVALSEMLRAELHGSGVAVSVLCPAFVKTNLTDTMRAPDDNYARRVQRWMETSGVSADDVAEQVFRAVRRPRFLLLTHANTRWQWWLKRCVPGLYFRLLMRTMKAVNKDSR